MQLYQPLRAANKPPAEPAVLIMYGQIPIILNLLPLMLIFYYIKIGNFLNEY